MQEMQQREQNRGSLRVHLLESPFIRLPAVVASCFELIGSATSGVAVFAVGLVLAAHPVRLSPGVESRWFLRGQQLAKCSLRFPARALMAE
jgi:predicted permease